MADSRRRCRRHCRCRRRVGRLGAFGSGKSRSFVGTVLIPASAQYEWRDLAHVFGWWPRGVLPRRVGSQLPARALVHHCSHQDLRQQDKLDFFCCVSSFGCLLSSCFGCFSICTFFVLTLLAPTIVPFKVMPSRSWFVRRDTLQFLNNVAPLRVDRDLKLDVPGET